MLKALEKESLETLTEMCNNIYNTGHIPEDFRQSIFVTIPKKVKALDCTDFRTISLMSHVVKMLLRIILERIKNKINREVGKEQCGFRPSSGTREAIINMRSISERHIELDTDVHVCFIDYAKAFDKVHHKAMIDCLQAIGLDGKDVRLIENLYWDQVAVIQIGNRLSPTVEIKNGVRQGCVLSPSLFNIYTEVIFREIEDYRGVNVGGFNVNNLRYADDTVLMAKTEGDLQNIVDKIKEESEKRWSSARGSKKPASRLTGKNWNRLTHSST